MSGFKVVGRPERRVDAEEKVTGTALYAGDMVLPGMLHAKALRPGVPRARIVRMDVSKARACPGVRAVLTAADVPGVNCVGQVVPDQPCIAEEVRFCGDAVAIAAADTPEQAVEALRAIELELEPLPGVFDPETAMSPDAPLVHPDGAYGNRGNVLETREISVGDVEAALAASDVVVDRTYYPRWQEHMFLETEAVLAVPDPDLRGVTIYASCQCPFYIRQQVARVLGFPLNRVTVIQPTVGGGFGGKEDVPSEPAARAALLAIATGRPVRKVRTRTESVTAHTKRHPQVVRIRLGARRDGTFTACDVELILDNGAYASVGPYVLRRAVLHACGPYRIPSARVTGHRVYTNNVPGGAFRGFGSPQTTLAMEQHVDLMAETLGMDPARLRAMNLLDEGDATAVGQVLRGCGKGARMTLDAVTKACDWENRRRKIEAFNRSGQTTRRGLGLAAVHYGVSLGDEALDFASGTAQILDDGTLLVAMGGTEMGQGAYTVVGQICAEELGVPLSWVRLVPTDTSRVQDSGPSVASRVTSVCGEAARRAVAEAKAPVYRRAAEALGGPVETELFGGEPYFVRGGRRVPFREVVRACKEAGENLQGSATYRVPYDRTEGVRCHYYTYSFAAHVAEAEVDTVTGVARIVRIWAANESGRVINPATMAGQVHGGAVQGMGYGLMEDLVSANGRILNPSFTDYHIPTAVDAPPVEAILVEDPQGDGPFGAKGVGEPSLIPTPAAVVNAVAHAIGKRLYRLPAKPEVVLAAIRREDLEPGEQPPMAGPCGG